MNEAQWTKYVSAKSNGDFTCVKTYSGYNLAMIDPRAKEHLLLPTASDTEVGKSILEALGESRCLPIEEARILRLNTEQNYKNWIYKLMTQYGYKTKNTLFKKMMSCGVELEDGVITIRPSNHEKLEAWSGDGIREEDYVKIPADSPPEEIGAALKLAFKRCRGPKPDEYK